MIIINLMSVKKFNKCFLGGLLKLFADLTVAVCYIRISSNIFALFISKLIFSFNLTYCYNG